MGGDAANATIELPSTGDAITVAALKTELLERLAAGEGVRLDARHVAEPSAALIQMIEAGAAAFADKTLPFGLLDPSDALCGAYETLGLFTALMSRIVMEM
ncbi:STAS domain-containing protein [Halotia wernerae UHCC 0503]|jgi:hypothetical protein|nr:STAS domain-containing protein [Halotia wernerae UHCC 0503]